MMLRIRQPKHKTPNRMINQIGELGMINLSKKVAIPSSINKARNNINNPFIPADFVEFLSPIGLL
jgi:hypothetical protein